MKSDFITALSKRGMIHDVTPGLELYLKNNFITGYIGFDLTAGSLHIGNLASIMLLKILQECGHRPMVLVGGATSMIGDPSFKKEERRLISAEEIRSRRDAISVQLKRLLRYDDAASGAVLVDNADWFADMRLIDFLRDVGKHISVNYMKSKDSVKTRMETGISYAEFTYQLFQAYDFYHLNKTYGVTLQMGGSDQWGNLTTGIELVRRKSGKEVFALTTPLITKSDGSKFGKSESGANIWLDRTLTTPYEFYQFWLNASDQDAERFVKVFTTIDLEDIEVAISRHRNNPGDRGLQRLLAFEVTKYIHSEQDAMDAQLTSEVLFGKETQLQGLSAEELLRIFPNAPKVHVARGDLESTALLDLLTVHTRNQIFASKAEVKRFMGDGGLLINRIKILDEATSVRGLLLGDRCMVVQRGKKNYYLIIVE